MSEPEIPSIADMVEEMIVSGCRGRAIVAAVRLAEGNLVEDAKYGRQRRSEDMMKRLANAKRKRDVRQMSADTNRGDSYTELNLGDSQRSKNPRGESPAAAVPSDDWPEEYAGLFWANYPGKRKYDQAKVFAKLARLRRDAAVTWAVLWPALLRLRDEGGDPQFIPAPMVWLNGARWMASGEVVVGMGRQKPLGFMDIARGKAAADGQ